MHPLVGHDQIRARLGAAVERKALPASMLLHGSPGAGKERLALWIAQIILCDKPTGGEPCGVCRQCILLGRGQHPDLHWYFPRPRLKGKDDYEDVLSDFAEGIEARMEAKGRWPAPALTDSLYVSTVRALVRRASTTPAMAAAKVIVVGDAHRLSPQEGNDEASNTFLKLLEEPLADTTIILTSSLPALLLPTIRSRVIGVRVPPLTPAAVAQLEAIGVEPAVEKASRTVAAAMLDAARGDAKSRYRHAMATSSAGARGNFSESLDALVALLHAESRHAAERGDDRAAANAARAIDLVEKAKRLTRQNVNPQLISATLLDDIAPLVA